VGFPHKGFMTVRTLLVRLHSFSPAMGAFMTASILRRAALAGAVAVVATSALAHTGIDVHSHGFSMGLAHPLSGLDHMLALAAVGIWAGQVGGRAPWLWPAACLGAIAAGGVLGSSGLQLSLVEPGIALSVLLLGLAVALAARVPVTVGAALCAVFTLVHGFAHGAEMPADASGFAYGAGFLVASAALIAAGLGLSLSAKGQAPRLLARGGGLAMALVGVGMLAG
jgi:urease accessory protein